MQEALKTDRLVLRHFTFDDAPRVRELVGNWKVARMLARVAYPYGDGLAEEWIAGHQQGRATGKSFPFAIEKDGELVGCVGLDAQEDGRAYEIGYWIGEPYWNKGIATEAGRALVAHAFDRSPADRLTAGHLAENHASGSVLTKLGFRYIGEAHIWSEARREKVHGLRMMLKRDAARPASESGR
ncbi:MAG: GNAT family N-acetyltransferase [Parvibaculum sp.]|uniref:GNAT family N-acetyltransferase n=1 Tax=Parvibaculum sp. TaxID=2024848 RepID=UPI0025FFCD35|nr:GNAT family N-acetyltransferase [Parvibaculum sp.]MCE9648450.1 GNAT family N-acetyltransferase [Parvibaculum sp.]